MEVDAKGKQKRRNRRDRTPLETLLALPQPKQNLRRGMTVKSLQETARRMSDTEAARRMQQSKQSLFAEMQRSA